jgi:hypothetical protein
MLTAKVKGTEAIIAIARCDDVLNGSKPKDRFEIIEVCPSERYVCKISDEET